MCFAVCLPWPHGQDDSTEGMRPVCKRNLREDERSLLRARTTGEGEMSYRSWAVRDGETGVLVGARSGALNWNGDGEEANGDVAVLIWNGEGFSRNGDGIVWKDVRIWCWGIVRDIGDRGSIPGS
jgi:hypothetical protein